MRQSDSNAVSLGLLGLAVAILAWIAEPEAIGYGVKFTLLLVAFGLFVVAVLLPAKAYFFERKRRRALDDLSQDIEWAIGHLINKPRPDTSDALRQFGEELSQDYDRWCIRVEAKLKDRKFFVEV